MGVGGFRFILFIRIIFIREINRNNSNYSNIYKGLKLEVLIEINRKFLLEI